MHNFQIPVTNRQLTTLTGFAQTLAGFAPLFTHAVFCTSVCTQQLSAVPLLVVQLRTRLPLAQRLILKLTQRE